MASTKCGHFISKVHNIEVKWSIKSCIFQTKKVINVLRKKLFEWIMKNSNVRESPISRDTLLITDAESGVKRRAPKLLLECSKRKLHTEIIASPDDGGLIGARRVNNYHIIFIDMSGSN